LGCALNYFIKVFFGCSISVPEIFGIKVDSSQKSRRNLDEGADIPKWYPRYHPSLAARGLEKFREATPTSREVIGADTLDFRPNF